MNQLAVPANQAGGNPLLLGLDMVEWLLAIIALLVIAGVATLAVVLLNRHRAAKHQHELHRDLQLLLQSLERTDRPVAFQVLPPLEEELELGALALDPEPSMTLWTPRTAQAVVLR